MALDLTTSSCTPQTWARLIRQPEDRREAAREHVESVGGQFHGSWYAPRPPQPVGPPPDGPQQQRLVGLRSAASARCRSYARRLIGG
jgi:hypothetical protein